MFTLCELGVKSLNYHRIEKFKNEMISRRDDEDVYNILRGGATKKSAIFELPSEGGPILPTFCVVRRSRTSRYASLLTP